MNRDQRQIQKLARKGHEEASAAQRLYSTTETLESLLGDPSQLTIIDVMEDPRIFGRLFADRCWQRWKVFLKALFALALSAEELEDFTRFTGRTVAPSSPAREGWVVVGRRGGKSRVAALVAVFLACFRSYVTILAPGERGTVMVLAADRRQARSVFRYVMGLLRSVPALAAMIERERAESVDLANGIIIEVHTASYKSVRGYTTVGVIADEIGFWSVEEGGANPDVEVMGALRPAMTTVPGAVLLGISTPYARRGELWRVFEREFGQDGDVLVWQAATEEMNPLVDRKVIARAYDQDPAAAAAEYGADFRTDLEAFLSPEAVAAVTIPDRRELPPVAELTYRAFTDPSGGSQDSFTLAIAHAGEEGRAVLDLVAERRPPFSPEAVVQEFAEVLRRYRIHEVEGDRFGGEFPRELCRKQGIEYRVASATKSDLYRELLPAVNSGRVELLDVTTLKAQLLGLERRVARGGKDSIDHAPRGRDDLANAAAGALVAVLQAVQTVDIAAPIGLLKSELEVPEVFDQFSGREGSWP